jgi:hypothetical protein
MHRNDHSTGWSVQPRPVSLRQLTGWRVLLADRGFYRAAWEAAYLIDKGCEDPDPDRRFTPASGFARACALGYPQAYYSLGLRFVSGDGVARDPDFGRALLLRASDGRFPDARDAADELAPAKDCPAAADWYGRLKQNLDAAQPMLDRLQPSPDLNALQCNPLVARLEEHFVSIGHGSLCMNGVGRAVVESSGSEGLTRRDPAWQWLAQQPRIAIAHQFATREECAHLMNKVKNELTEPSAYYGSGSANDDAELLRFTGRGCPINAMRSDSVVRELEHRLAQMTAGSIAAMEPCSIVHYQVGQEYQPHVDFFTDEQIELNRTQRLDFGGQRVATFLLYLRAPDAGGETDYPRARVRVTGERGMGVLHYNVTPDGLQDLSSLHQGNPIVRGEKWLWRSTLRAQPLFGA